MLQIDAIERKRRDQTDGEPDQLPLDVVRDVAVFGIRRRAGCGKDHDQADADKRRDDRKEHRIGRRRHVRVSGARLRVDRRAGRDARARYAPAGSRSAATAARTVRRDLRPKRTCQTTRTPAREAPRRPAPRGSRARRRPPPWMWRARRLHAAGGAQDCAAASPIAMSAFARARIASPQFVERVPFARPPAIKHDRPSKLCSAAMVEAGFVDFESSTNETPSSSATVSRRWGIGGNVATASRSGSARSRRPSPRATPPSRCHVVVARQAESRRAARSASDADRRHRARRSRSHRAPTSRALPASSSVNQSCRACTRVSPVASAVRECARSSRLPTNQSFGV